MSTPGYYRHATIHEDTVVFVCEGDLWSIESTGGVARRLTANLGDVTHPFLSPDGSRIAFTGREEGPPEAYVMPAAGGSAIRLTYQGQLMSQVVGWHRDDQRILLASCAGQPFVRMVKLFAVEAEGGIPKELPYGLAQNISFAPKTGVVLGRFTADPARWKRYRGGTCGKLWIDTKETGDFTRLIELDGNLASPMWVGGRVFFLSDHEGIGNLYSCRPSGRDLQRHTDHEEFYARQATTDGRRIVYACGSDLWLFDPQSGESQQIPVDLNSSRTQRNRKFVSPSRHLRTADLHPQGSALAIVTRGKPFTLLNWDGPVLQHGQPEGVRYRLLSWLADGKRLVAISDETSEECIALISADASKPPALLPDLDIGRAIELQVSPTKDQVAISNHRCELIFVDLNKKTARVLDKSHHERIHGLDFSPDGRWLAYGFSETAQTSIIKLCRLSTGKTYSVTEPVLYDIAPSFDPDGKYLYFLSHRVFDPVYDNLQFDLNFPRGMKPYLITLQKDVISPFVADLMDVGPASNQSRKDATNGKTTESKTPEPLQIDLAGIEKRIVSIPVPEGKYEQICGLPGGKVLFTSLPVEGSLNRDWRRVTPTAKASLQMYNLADRKQEQWVDRVSSFSVSSDHKWLLYRSADRLRVIKTASKPKAESTKDVKGRESGWIDLSRIRVSVNPPDEWRQMYSEAWRLQRDHFWTQGMSGVEWQRVYKRYLPLLDRVATRAEFSDLMWEMQGELGTSHAYEFGGDYRQRPRYDQGFLAADFEYDERRDAFRITHIAEGDDWDNGKGSPLHAPGVNVRPGDFILAINGRQLNRQTTPLELLVNLAGSQVMLTVARGRSAPRTVTVKVLRTETAVRYRAWVELNRQHVHDTTKNRVGYVHIPNMGPAGFAEFHRYYLSEVRHDGLIVDVRFNGGGHVSQLLLEKLTRRRVGYCQSRWSEPVPYPEESILGPLVGITNEYAGSDGDIFSHCFKLLNLGPLIGRRTWGGVIGISPRHPLVDGSLTTQPEFSFWFEDVGWEIENRGTDPDIDVDIKPQESARGEDPQLDRAITEVNRLIKSQNPQRPSLENRPGLALPKLPPRDSSKKPRT